MPRAFLIALLLSIGLAGPAAAEGSGLAELKFKAEAVREMEAEGLISAEQSAAGLAHYVERARALDAGIADAEALLAVEAEAETVESRRLAGLFDFLDSSRVIAGVIGVLCVLVLAGHFISDIMRVFSRVPLFVYEMGLHAASIAFVIGGRHVPDWGHFLGFIGCLGIGGSIVLSATLRGKEPNHTAFSLIMAAVTAAVAIWYGSALIGFLTAIALMSAVGFSAGMNSLCYALGFRDQDAVARATMTGFALLALFVGIRILGADVPHAAVFEKGALFMGSLTGYLGLLILSSRWQGRGPAFYAAMQAATLVAGIAALGLGSVLGIGELQKIGGTFFCLWLLEKITEIPVRSVKGWAVVGLLAAVGVYLGADAAQDHIETIRPYILFL